MDYLNTVNDRFPVRRSKDEKQQFQKFALEESERLGYSAHIDTLQNKHHNVVVGDLKSARVVFTAHYDTPASSLLPNLMIPKNPVLLYLYHIGYPFCLAMISLLGAMGLKKAFSMGNTGYIAMYLALYGALFYICTRAFSNKHNKNDNTSGVAVIFSLMKALEGHKVAFILFDNEEKGLLGSKACAKEYKEIFSDKLLINMDCVGVGKHVLSIAKPEAEQLAAYRLFQKHLKDADGFEVHHFSAKNSRANTDFKNFPCGVGIMSCSYNKILRYYTGRIHTNRDTVACTENIGFLTKSLTEFAMELEGNE